MKSKNEDIIRNEEITKSKRGNIKLIAILQIVFGAISLGIGVLCDLNYDWGYVALVGGAAYLLSGIFKLLNKIKVMAVLEIVCGAIALFLSVITNGYDWAIEAMLVAIAYLLSGIIWAILESKKSRKKCLQSEMDILLILLYTLERNIDKREIYYVL